MGEFNAFILSLGISSVLFVIIHHRVNSGKYVVEELNLAFPILLLTVPIRILLEQGFRELDTFLVSIGISAMMLLLIFLMKGLSISVLKDFQTASDILKNHELLKKKVSYDGLSKVVFTLEDGTKVRLFKRHKLTEITITSKLNFTKIMELRRQLMPALIEIDQRKNDMKGFYIIFFITITILIVYGYINYWWSY
ncbi:hypothetical protein [Alkaliphilus hydrothermalis]|uniref:Cobalt transport protein n=1 Tax=Alkaliphilus hydrothermalis TaxID=1482730 RepID=A0ABS2NL93_9FIRM|nr:hypothetical protein [Alkaliphilus hydrothermalis]MBM7613715.1 hypothetical protein [Alkaliphilus hydrothermalis]